MQKSKKWLLAIGICLLTSPALAFGFPLSEAPDPPELTEEDRLNISTEEQRERLATIQLARHAYILLRDTDARVFCGVDTNKGFLAYDKDEDTLYLAYLTSTGDVQMKSTPMPNEDITCLDAHAKLASFGLEVEKQILGLPAETDGPLHCPVDARPDFVF